MCLRKSDLWQGCSFPLTLGVETSVSLQSTSVGDVFNKAVLWAMCMACDVPTACLVRIYKFFIVFGQYSVSSFCHSCFNLRQNGWEKVRKDWVEANDIFYSFIAIKSLTFSLPFEPMWFWIFMWETLLQSHGLLHWSSQRGFLQTEECSWREWVCCFLHYLECSAQGLQVGAWWTMNYTRVEAVIGEQRLHEEKGTDSDTTESLRNRVGWKLMILVRINPYVLYLCGNLGHSW